MNKGRFVLKMDRFTKFVIVIGVIFVAGMIGLGIFAEVTDIAPAAGFDLIVLGVKFALALALLPLLSIRSLKQDEPVRTDTY